MQAAELRSRELQHGQLCGRSTAWKWSAFVSVTELPVIRKAAGELGCNTSLAISAIYTMLNDIYF